MSKKVLFFGIYDPAYSRNRVLMQGFRENDWEVVECRVDPKITKGLAKYIELWRDGKEAAQDKYDLVLVAFPGQTIVWLARLIFGKEIVVDLFLSLYDSNVFDRKLYSKYSFGALRDYLADWTAIHLSRLVLLDTNQHIEYAARMFHATKDKFVRVPIGAPDEMFKPLPPAHNQVFTVHFHGMFIPLQGIEYILDAADILKNENIVWNIIGKGQMYQAMEEKKNKLGLGKVAFKGLATLEQVRDYIAGADVCLGIFGATDKTLRVIPNKVYECVAMGKPVISADSPAIREIFHDREDVLLCQVANGADLAKAIMFLKSDSALKERIAKGGLELYRSSLVPKHLVKELLDRLE